MPVRVLFINYAFTRQVNNERLMEMKMRNIKPLAFSFIETEKGHKVHALYFFLMLLGIGFSYAFQPYNMAPVVFLITPLLVWIIDRAPNARAAFARGWFFGFGLFIKGMSWVGYSFTMQDEVPVWLAPIAVVALAAVLAAFKGLAFALAKRLAVPGVMRIVSFTCAWMIAETLQGSLFTGLPWLLVGSMWADWTAMLQGAALVGVYGLSLATVFIAASPALFLELEPTNSSRWTPVAAMGLLIVWAGFGIGRLNITEVDIFPGFKMRLVQARIEQQDKWLSYLLEDHFSEHLKLTRQESARGKAENIDLIIWPETAVPENLSRRSSLMRYRMSQLVARGAHIISGAPRIMPNEDGSRRIYNSLYALDEQANVVAQYDKFHLVPFGEYLPFGSVLRLFGLDQLTGGGEGFRQGPGPRTISIEGVPSFSPLICYEVIFPDKVSDWQERPEWLLNVTNDAWFGLSEGPYQHLALARMRAVEEGLALVRVAGSGITVVIDPLGRNVASMKVGVKGIIDSSLPMPLQDLPTLGMKKHNINMTLLVSLILLSLITRIKNHKRY